MSVAQEIILPGGDRVVLYSLSAPDGERGAIARLHSSGRRRWTVRPPAADAEDAFVAMKLEGDDLTAQTFQGLSIRIDVRTGAALTGVFVK